VALARRIADAKRPAAVFIADDMLRCRMYASWSEFSRGWRRIYIELARRNPRRLVRAAIRVIQFGTIYPIAALTNCIGGVVLRNMAESLAWPHAAAWGLAGALVGGMALIPLLLTVGASYRIGRAPLWALPAFPIGAAIVAGMMFRASRDLRLGRAIEWGGRRYVRALPPTQPDTDARS
ncbi:MAG: hypothetical protein NTV94_09915, partial [Planctomycetota bacterium]|nr:hypothetical protein [Planctomycetota bacterium]